MKLYKYRSISGDTFRYTQDIFVNRRLFLPQAKMLNDPNEGIAIINIKNELYGWGNQIEERNRQSSVRICAFSETQKNSVMWSHYAAEHRGICIEFEESNLVTNRGILKKVNYSNKVPIIEHNSSSDIKEAFLNKTLEWTYEKEWRYITNNSDIFLAFDKLAIKRVLLGARFEQSNLDWVKFWISYYNKDIDIPIVQMKFASTDYDLYEEHEMSGKIGRF
jgi:hypothetical protein